MSRILRIQKDKLSPRQQEVLDFVITFIAQHAYAPTENEIAAGLGFTRSNTQYHLISLELKNRIRRKPKGAYRNIKIINS